MEIGTVVMFKHPVERVWRLMRDELETFVTDDGISAFAVVSREAQASGGVRVVSEWQADVSVPALAAPYVDADMFCWQDDSVWDDDGHVVRWRVKTRQLTDRIDCAGQTRYEPAMGGRGTRLTMAGEFGWDLRGFLQLPPGLEARVGRGIEQFIGGLVTRNVRRIAEAGRRRLEIGSG